MGSDLLRALRNDARFVNRNQEPGDYGDPPVKAFSKEKLMYLQ